MQDNDHEDTTDEEQEQQHPAPTPPSNINHDRSPGTPSTLGEGSLAAGVLGPADSASQQDESSSAVSGRTNSNKRVYDHTVRDQTRVYFPVMDADEGGSYDTGGVFSCSFCKQKKFLWKKGFNITVARNHLVNVCSVCPEDVKDWVVATSSQYRAFKKNKPKRPGQSSSTITDDGTMRSFVRPAHEKSVMSSDKAHEIIVAHIEMYLSYFDSPTRVYSPYSIHALQKSSGTGIRKHIPNERQVWDMVSQIDHDASEFMLNRLKMEPGNLTIGFDGVTALGKHATLYTFSKGAISLFVTIR
jgi:hypothetical protein